jgi:hypothetical protein
MVQQAYRLRSFSHPYGMALDDNGPPQDLMSKVMVEGSRDGALEQPFKKKRRNAECTEET